MNKTKASSEQELSRMDLFYSLTINLDQLCMLLNCGKQTARDIASKAKAGVYLNKRTLYNVSKIRDYLDIVAV